MHTSLSELCDVNYFAAKDFALIIWLIWLSGNAHAEHTGHSFEKVGQKRKFDKLISKIKNISFM